MGMSWFRMYAEFATDAKVQSMSEAMQRRLTMILCLRCSDVTVTLCDEELAFQLRISMDELAETKALFLRKGFIENDWSVCNWEKRQYASDSSAARTKAYRERIKNVTVTSHVTKGDALDTDTDTDTEKSKKQKAGSRFAEFWSAYPVKKGRADAEAKWKARKLDAIADTIIADVKRRLAEDRQWRDGYIPHGSTYVNGRGWEDAIEPGRAGANVDTPDYLVGAI